MNRDLHTLNCDAGAEKPDRYLQVYERLFSPLRDEEVSLLELGVRDGGSIKLWDGYFSRAEIFGLDLKLPATTDLSLSDRVELIQGSQDDTTLLEGLAQQTRKGCFDIIIDDASHVGKLTKASFWTLFPLLQRGGLYIIEDWGTGYWEDFSDGRSMSTLNSMRELEDEDMFPSHAYGIPGFAKQLLDECGANAATRDAGAGLARRTSEIASMTITTGQIVLEKA